MVTDEEVQTLVIEVVSGPAEGERRELQSGDELVVGRGSKAELRIKGDRTLSRAHFAVEHRGVVCHVIDLGSQNGILLGKSRVKDHAKLQDGDTIEAGSSTFRIWVRKPEPKRRPPRSDIEAFDVNQRRIRCRECNRVLVIERATILVDDEGNVLGKGENDFVCRECRQGMDAALSVQFPGYRCFSTARRSPKEQRKELITFNKPS